jgi:SAM-dependent methyltransferase
MNENHIIQKIDNNRWKQAQEFELKFARTAIESDDDWNQWWYEKFNRYSILNKRHFENILEVGCGPHTNIRYILPEITFDKIWLEDPLIQFYITYNLNKSNSFFNYLKTKFKKGKINYLLKTFSELKVKVDLSSSKLEDLPYKDHQMDIIVCINVLDHVSDYNQCMNEIFRVLKKDGILILGQDLSNEEDLIQCPESYSDIGHPIKVDHHLIEQTLDGKYTKLFETILLRQEGRNPDAHYGTYLGILQKICQ